MCLQEDQLQIARNLRASEPEETQVQTLAYYLWERRGSPIGNPEEDWGLAEQLLSLAKAEERVKATIQAPEPKPLGLTQEIVLRYNRGQASQEKIAHDLGVTRWRVRKALGMTGRPSYANANP